MTKVALLLINFEDIGIIKKEKVSPSHFSKDFEGAGKNGIIFSGWYSAKDSHNFFVNKNGIAYLGENKSGKSALDFFRVRGPIEPVFDMLKDSDTSLVYNPDYKLVKNAGKFAVFGINENDIESILQQKDFFKKICQEARQNNQSEKACISCRITGKPEVAVLGLMNDNTASIVNIDKEIFTLFGMKNVKANIHQSPQMIRKEILSAISL